MPLLKIIIEFIRHPEMYISNAAVFILKCLVITMCLSYLLSSYMPIYEFPTTSCRCNTVNGTVEHYDGGLYGSKMWWK